MPNLVPIDIDAPPSLAQAYDALKLTYGNIGLAAKVLDVPRRVIQKLVDDSTELAVAVKDMQFDRRETIVDIAQEGIFQEVEKGDKGDAKFILQTLGRERGFVQGVAGGGKNGAIEISIRKLGEE